MKKLLKQAHIYKILLLFLRVKYHFALIMNCKNWYTCMEHLCSLYGLFPSLSNHRAFFEDGSWSSNTPSFAIGRSFNHRISIIAFSLIQETFSTGQLLGIL